MLCVTHFNILLRRLSLAPTSELSMANKNKEKSHRSSAIDGSNAYAMNPMTTVIFVVESVDKKKIPNQFALFN